MIVYFHLFHNYIIMCWLWIHSPSLLVYGMSYNWTLLWFYYFLKKWSQAHFFHYVIQRLLISNCNVFFQHHNNCLHGVTKTAKEKSNTKKKVILLILHVVTENSQFSKTVSVLYVKIANHNIELSKSMRVEDKPCQILYKIGAVEEKMSRILAKWPTYYWNVRFTYPSCVEGIVVISPKSKSKIFINMTKTTKHNYAKYGNKLSKSTRLESG